MTYDELKILSERQGYSIALDRAFPRHWRWVGRVTIFSLLIISFSISILENLKALAAVEGLFADGLSLFLGALLLILLHLEAFYYSSRFAHLGSRLKEYIYHDNRGPDYAVARILYETDDLDVTSGFLASSAGQKLCTRLDISLETLKSYLDSNRTRILENQIRFENEKVSFYDYAAAIYACDASLQAFLASNSVNEKHYLGAANWLSRVLQKREQSLRFWSRDNLESIASLGTTWSYGIPVELQRYGSPLEYKVNLNEIDLSVPERDEEIDKLENIISRDEGANVVIVDDEERTAKSIISRLYKKIRLGSSLSALEHKQVIELEWKQLLADKNSKAELESELLKLLREDQSLGNIIIYIPDLPQFIQSAHSLGVSVPSILEEFTKSKRLSLIAHSGKMDFHYFIENSPGLVTSFERLVPKQEGAETSLGALEERAEALEQRWNIFFSYQSLLEIAESAESKIVYGEMPEKAIDLMDEIVPWALKEKIKIVSRSDVSAYMEEKTGMPSSEIGNADQEKLDRLDETMHERIVGQESAVQAVSKAMRRVRSGLTSSKRPFASFLFLGPTGVGKTETCKALAEVFFGGGSGAEEKITRFDMSEYKSADALPQLIGSFNEGKTGLLASRLRDNPYGVLLLDEFEKASPDVHDLFLQILDEGYFTDALGSKVNCRNLIIVATSNAGSQLIWQMVEDKQDLAENSQKILDHVIAEGIFKPELLNRFDGTIIFSPLHENEMVGVAEKMFQKFAKRLEEDKQIKISAAPDLLDYLVKSGANEEFGARSINRVLQDKVEDFVAKKIISKELTPGSNIVIKAVDL